MKFLKKTASSYTDFALFRRLLSQARPYWLHIGGVFLLNLLSIPLALLTPLPLKIAVDSVIGSQPLPGFLDTLLAIVGHFYSDCTSYCLGRQLT